MLIVDKPQDTSKNIQNKELKKKQEDGSRNHQGDERQNRDRERDVLGNWDSDGAHTQEILGKSKSKAVHPLERFPIAMDTCTVIIRVL